MKHGSLFSGIGGFDLAAEWIGWENTFHCEWNPFGQKVLKYYWPESISYNDITKTNFTIHRGSIDILTGGFPCQPYSSAGKRQGTADDRHLWPEMLRAIREISPRYVVGENVRGLTNWNGGLVFDQVQADLEAEGYEVLPFLLPACAVNAPHRRDRIWFIAHARSDGHQSGGLREDRSAQSQSKSEGDQRERLWNDGGGDGESRISANTNNTGVEGQFQQPGKTKWAVFKAAKPRDSVNSGLYNWQNFPTQLPVCSRNDGIPYRLDGITFSKWRQESIKAYGNAIVPQVALQIFKAIEQYEAIK